MKNILTHKRAFSLAEALITILIVCLITLASVPVLTKKKRDLQNIPHGVWTCAMDENGNHISWSQDSPTPVKGDGSCKFVPPARAQNFVIKAVGGGGGGGGGFSEKKFRYFYQGYDTNVDFIANGYYQVALVGGGGGGGGGNDERSGTRAYAGGSGGSVYFTFMPKTDISYKIAIGSAGPLGKGDDGKHSGDGGSDGGHTSFAGMVYAYGGGGGGGVRYNGGPNKPGPAGGNENVDKSGSFTMLSYDGRNGVQGTQNAGNNKARHQEIIPNDMLADITINRMWIGSGGQGGKGKNGHGSNGCTGYASIKSNELSAGSRGQASTPMTLPVAQMSAPVEIILGTGGKGAVNKFTTSGSTVTHTLTNPENGNPTRVGDLFTVFGGSPGYNKAIKPPSSGSMPTYLEGENGQISNFDKDQVESVGGRKSGVGPNSNAKTTLSAGCGGGGGGAYVNSGANADNANIYSGNGANGAPGKVVITW